MLIINADDIGRTREITDRIVDCFLHGRIHSASAMVFMEDSERVVQPVALNKIPVGLHLNFTLPFTGDIKPSLRDQHNKIVRYLNAEKASQLIYNPFLRSAFEYVYKTQWDEFCRLYEKEPERLDGHHHMHLCMNMIFSGLYPEGIRVRRNFTFFKGERNLFNRSYRYFIDRWLTSHFKCTDSFFSATPFDMKRLERLIHLSKTSDVELMVHPGEEKEYEFIMGPEWEWLIGGTRPGS